MSIEKKGSRANQSTRDYIYYILRNRIMSLELKPGTKISEKEVAESLQVSRTPVREAFLKLSQEELLEIYPQSGTKVSLIDLNHVMEARFVRENIERAIVRLACEAFSDDTMIHLETNIMMQDVCSQKKNYAKLYELDDEFHKLLYYGCEKGKTWNMVQQMNSHFNRLRMLRLSTQVLKWDIIITQHKEIFELINKNQPQKAEEVMMSHLQLAVIEKDVLIEKYPDYFKI